MLFHNDNISAPTQEAPEPIETNEVDLFAIKQDNEEAIAKLAREWKETPAQVWSRFASDCSEIVTAEKADEIQGMINEELAEHTSLGVAHIAKASPVYNFTELAEVA